jgi:hypothetical protein
VRLFNTEFTERPICTASRQYQELKLREVLGADLSEQQRAAVREGVLAKSCICHDLAGGVARKYGIDPAATPAICCGPNIVNFSRIATLDEMVGHIYGRCSLLSASSRPHMFLRELSLYVEYLGARLAKNRLGLDSNAPCFLHDSVENLRAGIDYYRGLADQLEDDERESFHSELESIQHAFDRLLPAEAEHAAVL